jgi:antitoxin component YwqK of YwqJK toxin-antitoxin module
MFIKSNFVKPYLKIILFFWLLFSCDNSIDFNQKLKKGENYSITTDSNEPITGSVIIKDSIGQIKIRGSLKGGRIHGEWLEYFSNGQLKYERNYSNQRFQGMCKEYYVNGQLKWIGKFENGERSGFHKSWYKNGKMKSEIYYINGNIEGLWQQWDKNGTLISGVYIKEKSNYFKELFDF